MTEDDRDDGLLSALLDGELTGDEAAALRARVDVDPGLAEEFEQIRSVRAAVRSLPAVAPPPGFFEGLLAGGLVDDEPMGAPAPVVPLRRRRLVAANAAAAVAAGLLLVVGFGGRQAQAVAPEVSGAVQSHASTLSAAAVGLGGADPILSPDRVSPTTTPRRSTQLPAPFIAPRTLAGYELVGAFRAGRGVHLLYAKGAYGLSVFEQEGDLTFDALPSRGTRLRIGGDPAWRWDGPEAQGRVVVIARGELILTLVGDESRAAVQAAAEALPGVSGPGLGTRLRRAWAEALDALSPAG